MSGETKKSGTTLAAMFSQVSTLGQLEKLVDVLNNMPGVTGVTGKSLAQVLTQFIVFQDEHLGKPAVDAATATGKAVPEVTKIPAVAFKDMSVGGSLNVIAATLYEARNQLGWRRFEFASKVKVENNIELVVRVAQALAAAGKLPVFKCFLDPKLDIESNRKLAAIVARHGGTVVNSPAAATHRVVPNIPSVEFKPDVEEEEFFRVIEAKDGNVLLHWWYYPDSYDQWVPETSLHVKPDPPEEPKVPRVVYARWLTDTERFNEWMNDEDYEPQEDEATEKAGAPAASVAPRAAEPAQVAPHETSAASRKRRRSGSSPPPADSRASKRSKSRAVHREVDPVAASSVPAAVGSDAKTLMRTEMLLAKKSKGKGETGSSSGTGPAPMEGVTPGGANDLSTAAFSEGIAPPAHLVPAFLDATTMKAVEAGRGLGAAFQAKFAGAARTVVVPSHASWFSLDGECHPIEVGALSEFFNGTNPSKTPEIYKLYRNFMVNTWRQDPSRYLSLTACRRSLTGDAGAMLRVHSFLESWGLINYQVNPETRPLVFSHTHTPHAALIGDAPGGVFPMNAAGEAALEETIVTTLGAVPAPPSAAGSRSRPEVAASKVVSKLSTKPNVVGPLPNLVLHCGGCHNEVTGPNWVARHPATSKPLVLCDSCFRNKRMPQGIDADAFTRGPEPSSISLDTEWTDEETLKLVKAVAATPDATWDEIARAVGTKSKAEVVARILKLPIEEPFLFSSAGEKPKPFVRAPNPAMSVVAFLTAAVSPELSAVAAYTALAAGADAATPAPELARDLLTSHGLSPAEAALVTNRAAAFTSTVEVAMRARMKAAQHDAEIQDRLASLVEIQLRKLQHKLDKLDKLDSLYAAELDLLASDERAALFNTQ
ncbi:swi/snf complex subunit smarcc1 [Thecamonas trahens ATCC 50062]|uniref:Swi/snf complex subunit smarcc1 n=1 Tax=Thecamonas trahens ATCC 50062 TaxID=461836 RepID=A0A0L0DNU6_THETB|nr:swi/snf complex subunit smarcc1 [Thecamonas trahens ATCC 50062]KNC53068.1 swi/snf complex subunit smarcc1 [Thecamonas trahens ATCC 50062]|eukprot:XP_013754743.1 swi/snf complex subunit smarcc1 [Thecamonas trahens ATCC 50062]